VVWSLAAGLWEFSCFVYAILNAHRSSAQPSLVCFWFTRPIPKTHVAVTSRLCLLKTYQGYGQDLEPRANTKQMPAMMILQLNPVVEPPLRLV